MHFSPRMARDEKFRRGIKQALHSQTSAKSHYRFLTPVESATFQVLFRRLKQRLFREVLSFSTSMQPHTTHVGNKFYCVRFGRKGRQFHNSEEVKTAVHEWLQMQEPYFYRHGIFTLVPRLHNCINVRTLKITRNYTSAE